MKDLRDILTHAQQLNRKKSSYAIATVVGTYGSSYRGLGARMLIEKEDSTGTITGGCLEEDFHRFAEKAIEIGKPQLIEYDYTDDNDYLFGTGMGCSGKLQVVITPMPSKNGQQFIKTLENVIEKRKQTVLITIINQDKHLDFSFGDTLDFSSNNTNNFPKQIESLINDFLQKKYIKNNTSTSCFRKKFCGLDILVEIFYPPLTLTIFGAGDDSKPLISSGIELGWEIQLVDHRPALANNSRFPSITNIHYATTGNWPQKLKLPPNSATVVMSHNYLQDQVILEKLLTLRLAYIGIIGSHLRNKKLLKDLEKKGIIPSNLENIYSPAGLDLGGDSPNTIALSICAEIHKVIYKATGESLSLNQGPIHDRCSTFN